MHLKSGLIRGAAFGERGTDMTTVYHLYYCILLTDFIPLVPLGINSQTTLIRTGSTTKYIIFPVKPANEQLYICFFFIYDIHIILSLDDGENKLYILYN